jgi:hypothetical protein
MVFVADFENGSWAQLIEHSNRNGRENSSKMRREIWRYEEAIDKRTDTIILHPEGRIVSRW